MMKIIKKIIDKQNNIVGSKPVTIAFLGDSVTQGCFECYIDEKGVIQTVFDSKSSYVNRFKDIMSILYPSVQINIINSGISGDNAASGCERFVRDIAPFNPDLVVVAYGLNDSCSGVEKIDEYNKSLKIIFENIKSIDAECIFIANNMMNTKVSCRLTDERMIESGRFFERIQNEEILKKYLDSAKDIAKMNDISVVDIYSSWEKMSEAGVDITELLANKFNHPIKELNYYTAIKLVEKIIGI